MTRLLAAAAFACALVLLPRPGVAQDPGGATARDGGPQTSLSVWECQNSAHTILKRNVSLENALVRYGFQFAGCQDPSHEGKHPCSEGNFGMPEPVSCNWYWCGFMRIEINGTDAALYTIDDLRVTDSGARAGFQVIWAHPDAEVGLRLMLRPGSNHVEGDLTWKPREGANLRTISLKLTCYPSFFTTSQQRKGERHCQTPRVDCAEGQPMDLQPTQDTWLYYYDAIFDMARGEGEGPCAAMVAPEAFLGGSVQITDYPVLTTVDLKPEVGEARLAFWDFAGKTNAEAREYLDTNGARDLADLQVADFRPLTVQRLHLADLQAEVNRLVAEAAEEGAALKPRADELLGKLTTLQEKAGAGDWRAQAEMASLVLGSEDLMWKLRIFAALNGGG
jgi:hypothetical protein